MTAVGRQKVLGAWVLAALAVAVSWLGFFFFRDNFATHFPLKTITAGALRSGEIPWWNFHAGGGQPLAGNPNALTFYPDTLLYLVLPPHVAFNLHFLIHLAGGWLAMRALTRSRFAATAYALSGVVVSATAFYNLVTAVALIPLALLGAERRSARIVGIAFGLMLLAAEPLMLAGAALSLAVVAAGRMRVSQLAMAVALAAAIGAPQILAFSEIAGEVERSYGMSAQTVLNTSLTPMRIAEIFAWPFSGFLNDAGGNRMRLFSTLFLGIIAIPALIQKSRYAAIAIVLLLLALGRNNPVVAFAVERFEWIRVMRFPEKLALPAVVALCVLAGTFYQRSAHKRAWAIVTLAPLAIVAILALPIDWYRPYAAAIEAGRGAARGRVLATSTVSGGAMPARAEYRLRAQHLEPLFGAVAGVRYAVQRSPDRMHSLISRIVVDRARVNAAPYARVALGPDARVVPIASAARNVDEAVARFEGGADVAPRPFTSAPARIVAVRERGQTIEIDVESRGPALVLVNQSYFHAWVARMDGVELQTLPVDVDRLGVIVPRRGRVLLTFGRHRAAVTAFAGLSLLLLAALPLVEKRDRRAGEVERAGDDDGPLG